MNKIIELEFEYAKDASLESQRDRLLTLNFYIGLFTVVFGAFIGLGSDDTTIELGIFVLAFYILALIGFIFSLQIVRLRQAWHDAAKAMGTVKNYAIKRDPDVADGIRWTLDTLPTPQKFKTVSFFTNLIIAILSGIALGMGMYLWVGSLVLCVFIGSLYVVLMVFLYWWMLKKNI